jgi:hypothetical protein
MHSTVREHPPVVRSPQVVFFRGMSFVETAVQFQFLVSASRLQPYPSIARFTLFVVLRGLRRCPLTVSLIATASWRSHSKAMLASLFSVLMHLGIATLSNQSVFLGLLNACEPRASVIVGLFVSSFLNTGFNLRRWVIRYFIVAGL